MYDGGRIRLAAIHSAKSAADGTAKTILYRLGLPALIVHRLYVEVVLRDGLDEHIERGEGGSATN